MASWKSGTWYSYGDARIGQGRENAKEYLKTHPETMKEVEERIMIQAGLKKGETVTSHRSEVGSRVFCANGHTVVPSSGTPAGKDPTLPSS
jgi:hypothetical protein